MTKSQISAKALELIPKSRIVSFASWQNTHPAELIQVFQQADDDRLYLN